jgi:hypothetical protein
MEWDDDVVGELFSTCRHPSISPLPHYTPHPITLFLSETVQLVLPPIGRIARCEEIVKPAYGLLGIPAVTRVLGPVTGLPEPQEAVFPIVSSMVQTAATDRTDLVAPWDFVRDASGRILGCRGFVRSE